MSDVESTPEKRTVNIRMTETLLEELDRTWKRHGYNSRSEFIRHVIRDSLKHPEFDRADLKAMLAGEVEIREGRTIGRDAVKHEYSIERPDRSE